MAALAKEGLLLPLSLAKLASPNTMRIPLFQALSEIHGMPRNELRLGKSLDPSGALRPTVLRGHVITHHQIMHRRLCVRQRR